MTPSVPFAERWKIEMEKDDNIRNKNLEVVDFVKEYMG